MADEGAGGGAPKAEDRELEAGEIDWGTAFTFSTHRTATVVHALQRENFRWGMVTMCIGTGMGAAGLFERM